MTDETETTETTEETSTTEETTSTEETTTSEETTQETAGDWRASIEDADLRKVADRFASPTDAIKAVADLRKRESTSIRALGKDPSDEEVAAYRKAIGVPETAKGYKFEAPEGAEFSDADKAFQASASAAFHELNIPADQAAGLTAWWNEFSASVQEAQIADDKKFADESEAVLKVKWPGKEYDRNKAYADRAAANLFGDTLDDAREIETKDGRFILDHPIFVEPLAQLGREMEEGRLGSVLSDGDRGGVESQIAELQGKIDKAQAANDHTQANKFYHEQQDLYRKLHGSAPIVGAEGVAA